MLSTAELEEELFEQPRLFAACMRAGDYFRAKSIYDTTRDVALFARLEEDKLLKLFGSRQLDPPVEGMFREEDVQKAYYECAVKRRTEKEQQDAREKERLEARERMLREVREKYGH